MEGIGFASLWRVAPAADTGARPAVWRVPAARGRVSEERGVSLVRGPVSHMMGGVEAFSSKAVSRVPLE